MTTSSPSTRLDEAVLISADDGVPIEQISRLVGHSGTSATELGHPKQIRPVEDGATIMDHIFPRAQV